MKQMAENVKKIVDSSHLKAQTADEVNTALAARNMDLAKRYEKLNVSFKEFCVEIVRLDRECKALKVRLDASEELVEQLKSECESKERALVASRQHEEQDTKAIQDSTSATVCLLHDFRERQLLDRQAQLKRETDTNAAFDVELVQLTGQIDRVNKRCEARLESNKSLKFTKRTTYPNHGSMTAVCRLTRSPEIR